MGPFIIVIFSLNCTRTLRLNQVFIPKTKKSNEEARSITFINGSATTNITGHIHKKNPIMDRNISALRDLVEYRNSVIQLLQTHHWRKPTLQHDDA